MSDDTPRVREALDESPSSDLPSHWLPATHSPSSRPLCLDSAHSTCCCCSLSLHRPSSPLVLPSPAAMSSAAAASAKVQAHRSAIVSALVGLYDNRVAGEPEPSDPKAAQGTKYSPSEADDIFDKNITFRPS